MKHKANSFGVALVCVAFGSQALTLGHGRGAVLVGQPLDLLVQVQMDAGEDGSSLCFDADVFHADTRQEASRVRVVLETTAQPQVVNVRVLSSAPIDEPVVTVYLRTGCGQKTTRRYVLLANLASEVSAPLPTSFVAPLSVLPPAQGPFLPAASVFSSASPVASNSVPAVKVTTGRVPTQSVQQEVAPKRPHVKAAIASPKRTTFVEKNKIRRPAGRSRLKLDPLELLSDRIANIDAYMTFAPSDDALLTMQKMQALEADVKALRALATKNDTSLVDLKTRLHQAELERFPGGWVYGLIAMVLACLAAVALLWNSQRRVHAGSDNWWSGAGAMPAAAPPEPGPSPEPLVAHQELDEELVSDKASSAALSGLADDSGPLSELDDKLMEMSESAFDNLMQSGVAHAANRKLPPTPAPLAPQMASVLSLKPEAVLDIRQQAEYFVSLGQTDLAVQILKKHIDENDVPNPLVYLDLLSLFHSLSLKIDFQRLHQNFNLLFNGRVPEFALFKNEGRGLESYPDVTARITAFWSTPTILEVLEACIFQDPRNAKMPSFDLAAFRDLLLLHDLALHVVVDTDPEIGGQTDFSDDENLPPPMLDLDLDLDLDMCDSEIEEFGPHSVAAADVDLPQLMLGDPELEASPAVAGRTLDIGNTKKFAVAETSKRPRPAGTKRGQRAKPG